MPTYLITWTTYGSWLPGDSRGSVAVPRNRPGEPAERPSEQLRGAMMNSMSEPPFTLTNEHREIVESTIREHCVIRQWTLHAVNVRTNHVHVVVSAGAPPEKAMGEFKAWSSRALHSRGLDREHIWSRHGSTRWIDEQSSLSRAIQYVVHEQ